MKLSRSIAYLNGSLTVLALSLLLCTVHVIIHYYLERQPAAAAVDLVAVVTVLYSSVQSAECMLVMVEQMVAETVELFLERNAAVLELENC